MKLLSKRISRYARRDSQLELLESLAQLFKYIKERPGQGYRLSPPESPAQNPTGFYGHVETEVDADGNQVYIIKGILSADLQGDYVKEHEAAYRELSAADKQKFSQSVKDSRAVWLRLRALLKAEGGTRFKKLPEELHEVYLAPSDKATIARAYYGADGNVLVTCDLDDVQSNNLFTLTYYNTHEKTHICSFHECKVTCGQNPIRGGEDGKTLISKGPYFYKMESKVGLSVTTVAKYKVTGITPEVWNKFVEVWVQLRNQNGSGTYSATPKVHDLIFVFRKKFGNDWIEQTRLWLKANLNNLGKLNQITAEIREDEADKINEALTDFVARMSCCRNPLEPTKAELAHYRIDGAYTNLKAILVLTDLYVSLESHREKIHFLSEVVKTLQYGDVEILQNLLGECGLQISREKILKASLGQSKNSTGLEDLIDVVARLFFS